MTLTIDKKSTVMFKLVVESITFKYPKGSFKVSAGAFQPFNWAMKFLHQSLPGIAVATSRG
jgi:hypothetical protein